jgi:hypothetical protein
MTNFNEKRKGTVPRERSYAKENQTSINMAAKVCKQTQLSTFDHDYLTRFITNWGRKCFKTVIE